MKINIAACEQARERIGRFLAPTPCLLSQAYSELIGHEVYLKYENKFRSGSFKERGALNFLLSLNDKQKSKGVLSASAGNHALALSYHAAKVGVDCQIVMPIHAPLVKIQSTRKNGARVILHGETLQESYQHAQELSSIKGAIFVSPYNHEAVIAGQGTCGLEIIEQCPDFDRLIVPVGGGGLIAGTATAIKAKQPGVKITGVFSQWAEDARQGKNNASYGLQSISIADGIAVKTIGDLTKPIIEKLVDDRCYVSEAEIASALVQFLEFERAVIEGAAAAAIAGLLKSPELKTSKRTVVVVSGSNIDMNMLSRLIERDMGERGRLLRMGVSLPDRPGTLSKTANLIAEQGGNILQVQHDRSFSHIPGNVEITFLLEVRSNAHKAELLSKLSEKGMAVRDLAR